MIIPTPDHNPKSRETLSFRAWQMVNEVYIACLVISVIYIAMGLYEGKLLIVEGVIIGALGILLSKETSRAAALLLISISLISFSNSMVSWLGIVDMGDRNILLSFIGLWCGMRAWKATVLLRGYPTFDDAVRRLVP